jgi:hypothetical protein
VDPYLFKEHKLEIQENFFIGDFKKCLEELFLLLLLARMFLQIGAANNTPLQDLTCQNCPAEFLQHCFKNQIPCGLESHRLNKVTETQILWVRNP